MQQYDVIIIGGGLAGLTAAIHLTLAGKAVLVLEKHAYPRHKVCGEYLSNEVRPYFRSLGVSLEESVGIHHLEIGNTSGRRLVVALPLGGMGISRYHLDHLLYKRAVDVGATVHIETVSSFSREGGGYRINTSGGKAYRGRALLGAYGKRSALDRASGRDFMNHSAPWLAVKAHYAVPDWQQDVVGLYPFPGGYAGVSATESGTVNLCYLAHYGIFTRHQSVEDFNRYIFRENPFMKAYFSKAAMQFSQSLCIAQIAFGKKKSGGDGILYCGDAAGLIHPLCGNGMAMAIHSAKVLSDLVIRYLEDPGYPFENLESSYRRRWNALFSGRLAAGRIGQSAFLHPGLASLGMSVLSRFPGLLRSFIYYTHGSDEGF